ncbi:MAG: phosphatase domain-containing protein [Rhodothermales bacterium]|nr:phosphatase domain-containing protein [Rhodothermales bacterium]
MLKLLTRALVPIEAVYDRTVTGLKWRFGWWEHLRVRPYLGYGTAERLHLLGRVLDDKRVDVVDGQTVWANVRHTIRRVESDEVPGARVRLTDGAYTLDAETNADGYFTFDYVPERSPETPWHRVRLDLLAPEPDDADAARAEARVLVPPNSARLLVVSDLDDTVVKTGATNKLKYARVVLLNSARSRLPFPGVGAFYRALQAGPNEADQQNPVFYVSSSPWNLFGQFHGFLLHRGIPEGPIFLKDFGIDTGKFIKSGHSSHKLDWIRRLLRTYPDLGVVLVGDSGQEDPEIYRAVVQEHPERVRAVYVRDVTDPQRDREVRAIADEVGALGVPMRLVAKTTDAAQHAAEAGLIRPDAVAEVEAEAAEEEAQPTPRWWERLLDGTPS